MPPEAFTPKCGRQRTARKATSSTRAPGGPSARGRLHPATAGDEGQACAQHHRALSEESRLQNEFHRQGCAARTTATTSASAASPRSPESAKRRHHVQLAGTVFHGPLRLECFDVTAVGAVGKAHHRYWEDVRPFEESREAQDVERMDARPGQTVARGPPPRGGGPRQKRRPAGIACARGRARGPHVVAQVRSRRRAQGQLGTGAAAGGSSPKASGRSSSGSWVAGAQAARASVQA